MVFGFPPHEPNLNCAFAFFVQRLNHSIHPYKQVRNPRFILFAPFVQIKSADSNFFSGGNHRIYNKTIPDCLRMTVFVKTWLTSRHCVAPQQQGHAPQQQGYALSPPPAARGALTPTLYPALSSVISLFSLYYDACKYETMKLSMVYVQGILSSIYIICMKKHL